MGRHVERGSIHAWLISLTSAMSSPDGSLLSTNQLKNVLILWSTIVLVPLGSLDEVAFSNKLLPSFQSIFVLSDVGSPETYGKFEDVVRFSKCGIVSYYLLPIQHIWPQSYLGISLPDIPRWKALTSSVFVKNGFSLKWKCILYPDLMSANSSTSIWRTQCDNNCWFDLCHCFRQTRWEWLSQYNTQHLLQHIRRNEESLVITFDRNWRHSSSSSSKMAVIWGWLTN